MTSQIIVTVIDPKFRGPVMEALEPFGDMVPSESLPRVFTAHVAEEVEADFMLSVANDHRISGAADGAGVVAPMGYGESFIYEPRMWNEKHGALRLKATQDPKSGNFNPWWLQPDFFKWRFDSDRLGDGVIIAIVDGGIRWGHPEFRKNPGRVTRIHNFSSIDFGASNHGTTCAALAAGDNLGIAPEAELWDVKVFSSAGGSTTNEAITAGLETLAARAVDPAYNPDGKFVVANLSFGSTGTNYANPYGSIIQDLMDIGVLVFIAAGNDSQNLDTTFDAWPAEASDYAVGAIHYDGRRAAFSNYGSRVRFYGFGHRVVTVTDGAKYGEGSGTSYATPYLCGCLATWLPGRWVPQDFEQVRTLLSDYMAFCSEGIYGESVRSVFGDDKIEGVVIARASYFPIVPGDVIVPQLNAVARFGTAEYGVLGWKSRATPIIGGSSHGVTGQSAKGAVFFREPFGFPNGGPWMDPAYIPTGWGIDNDQIKNRSGAAGTGMFAVSSQNLALGEYWEIEPRGAVAGMSVGITKVSNLGNYNEATTGMGAAGVEWFSDGSLTADGVAQTATISYVEGDRLMLAYDNATGEFWCGKNGVWAAEPGVDAALATTATGASRAAVSVPDGSQAQLYGESTHVLYTVAGFTPFDLGAEIEWKIDPALISTGHTLSENDTRLTNTSGGSDYRPVAPSDRVISAAQAGMVYWEMALLAGPSSYTGYLGIVGTAFLAANPPPNNVTNPVYAGMYNWRGNGTIWGPTGSQAISGVPTYGIGDRLMFCYEPTTGKFWFGKNGTWDRNPETEAPRVTQPIEDMRPFIQTRDTGVSAKLISLSSDFLYSIPSGAVALGTLA